MFAQIGAVLVGAPAERERTPVRRHSSAAGRCEGVFWRRTNRQEVRTILLAAKRYELAQRQPGERSGPLGSVAIEVLMPFITAKLINEVKAGAEVGGIVRAGLVLVLMGLV